MANTFQLCLIFTVVVPYGLHATRILSMRVNTKGYTLGIIDKTENLGLTFNINTYVKGNNCMKVVNIEQLLPQRSVDEIQVSCDPPNWSVTKSMVHYGDVIHIQTRQKKVVWAIYDLGDKCIQKTYRDKGVPQLGKLVLNLNREECDQVVATQTPKRKTKDAGVSGDSQTTQTNLQPVSEISGANPSAVQDVVDVGAGDALLTGSTTTDNANVVSTTTNNNNNGGMTSEAAVISLDELGTDMFGYYTNEPSVTVNSGPLMLVIGTYYKGTECVKQIIMYLHGDMVDQLKVTCESTAGWGDNGYYQYGKAFFVVPNPDHSFTAIFRLKDNKCIRKKYVFAAHDPTELTKTFKQTGNNQKCVDLRNGMDFVSGQVSLEVKEYSNPITDVVGDEISGVTSSTTGDDFVAETTPNNVDSDVMATTNDNNNARVSSTAAVISLDELGTDMSGYYTNEPSITVNSGPLMLVIGTYYKGTECVKQIIMYLQGDMVDQLKVTCESTTGWGDNGYYQYGKAFLVCPEKNNNFRALFRLKDNKCIKKTYIFSIHDPTELEKTTKRPAVDQECVDLGFGKDFVTGQDSSRNEGDSNPFSEVVPTPTAPVVSTSSVTQPPSKKPSKKPGTTAVAKPGTSANTTPMTEESRLLNKQKVVVPNGNINGYVKQGNPITVQGRGFRFTFQKYIKSGTGECVKLVGVQNNQGVVDQVKISCEFEEPDKLRGFNLNIGNVIFENPPFNVKYVVKDGVCLDREYFRGEKGDKKLSGSECDKLTGRTQQQRISGVIRGNEPMSPADLAAMEKQIVAVLDGSIKDFKPQGSKSVIKTKTYIVEVQNYVKDNQCVKVMSIKRKDHDQYFERVKMSCKINGPTVTKNPDYELIYGNLIYIEDRFATIFVVRNGLCLKRDYFVFRNEVEKTDKVLNEYDCNRKTRWSPKMRKSPSKLNRQLPPKKASGDYSYLDGEGNVQSTPDIPDTPAGAVISVPDVTGDFDQLGGELTGGGVDDLDLAVHEAFESDFTADDQIDLMGGGQQPDVSSSTIAPSAKEFELLNKQKVVVLNANVKGFQREGPPNTVQGRGFSFTIEKYVKPGTAECVKLVTIIKGGEVMDKVKMSCEYEEPDKLRGFDLHISSIIFEDPPFDMKYVIEGGECVKREYFRGDITEKKMSEESCFKLTKRTKAQRISGIIPGTEPITPEDLHAMENEIVAVLDGSLKGYRKEGPKSTFSSRTGLYEVEEQNYVKGTQCIKVVSFKRNDHDQYFDRVKLSCKIKGPVVTNDEDMEMIYGNVIYLEDRFDAVFIMKGGECLKRDYFVFRNDVEKTDKKMSLSDCFTYTRWKLAQRKSAIRLNKPVPPKTIQAPGFGWILALNGDTRGYKPDSTQNNMNGNAFGFNTQDFIKGDEECVRLVVIKIYNKVVDSFKISCGPSKGLTINNMYIRYGRAFTFQPDTANNKYKALFNLRDGSCIPRTYIVSTLFSVTMTQGAKVNNNECKELREGNLNSSFSISGGTFNIGNNNNIITSGKQSGLFGGIFGSWQK